MPILIDTESFVMAAPGRVFTPAKGKLGTMMSKRIEDRDAHIEALKAQVQELKSKACAGAADFQTLTEQ